MKKMQIFFALALLFLVACGGDDNNKAPVQKLACLALLNDTTQVACVEFATQIQDDLTCSTVLRSELALVFDNMGLANNTTSAESCTFSNYNCKSVWNGDSVKFFSYLDLATSYQVTDIACD